MRAQLAIALAFLTTALEGAVATVQVQPHGALPPQAEIVLTRSGAAAGTAPVRAAVRDGRAAADVPAGRWCAGAAGEGVWSEAKCFDVASDMTVPFDVWAATTVRGHAASSTRKPLSQLLLRFQGVAAGGERLSGEGTCPVREGVFTCVVPAGAFDLKLRPRAHIAHYLFGIKTAAGSPADVPAQLFALGDSIIGRVELPPQSRVALPEVAVTAVPLGGAESVQPLIANAGILGATVHPDRQGVFHIDGVMPGEYILTARHPSGLTSNGMAVPVRRGAESELRDPLVLTVPHHITLHLAPPQAPDGRPWIVRLARDTNRSGSSHVTQDVLSQSGASAAGEWKSPALTPARYSLNISTLDEDVWDDVEVVLAGDDETRTIALDGVAAAGRLRLGDKPLAAKLTFDSTTGRTLSANSDQEGNFHLSLPAAVEEWQVQVEATAPAVRRLVDRVRLHDGRAEIDLPDTLLFGMVVDEDHAPVKFPILNVQPPKGARMSQIFGDETGHFEMHGIVPGDYVLSAQAVDSDAEPTLVTVGDDPPPPVTLVARKHHEVTGRVVSDLGPVAGAAVIISATDQRQGPMAMQVTDAAGAFVTTLPVGPHEIDVIAAPPGFSYTIDHLRYEKGQLIVHVAQQGGTLVLKGRADDGLFLAQGGATVQLGLVMAQWPGTSEVADGVRTTRLPMMEPGPYSLCRVQNVPLFRSSLGAQGGECTSGWLDASGTLALTLP
jgi:hypothetical protein